MKITRDEEAIIVIGYVLTVTAFILGGAIGVAVGIVMGRAAAAVVCRILRSFLHSTITSLAGYQAWRNSQRGESETH